MKREFHGLTLLNLLIALFIISLLLTIGIPNFVHLIHRAQRDNAYRELMRLIQFSRNQAVHHGQQVILCPSIDQHQCTSDWHHPLIIFVDSNSNETREEEEKLLQHRTLIKKNYPATIVWKASGSLRYIRYQADGRTHNQNGRLTYCLQNTKTIYAAQVIIYLTGRARRGSDEEEKIACS